MADSDDNIVKPVDGHGREVENASGDGGDSQEVVDGAVGGPEAPVHVAHEHVVEGGVEGGHEQVGERHVGQERVRDGAHEAVRCGEMNM